MFEIGNSLREARLKRGIEIAQVEQATKIRGKYLCLLEDERFDTLPSDTYVKGFLRTYADYLGLDGQLYVDEYSSRFVIGEDDARRPRRSQRPDDRGRGRLERGLVVFVLVAITIVTVVVISAWGWASSGNGTSSGNEPSSPTPKRTATRAVVPGLQITAVKGPSYVAVRRGGAAGKVIYQGTVARRQHPSFAGTRFWVNVSTPENLVIKVRGERIRLDGGRPQVVTITPASWHVG